MRQRSVALATLLVAGTALPAAGQNVNIRGRIVAAESLGEHATVLDASGCLLIPGNVNAHMHAYAALALINTFLAPAGAALAASTTAQSRAVTPGTSASLSERT